MLYEEYYQNFLNTNIYPRELKKYEFIPESSVHVIYNNTRLINFSSNDYLGLAKHPQLITRSQEFVKQFGTGSTSSRLVVGNLSLYENLEQQLAKALNKPAALILGTGYQTNSSVLEALLDKTVLGQEPLVFCDKLVHASMLANTRYLSRLQRFRHNDLDHLEALLKKYPSPEQTKFILAESVYSMEGDQADLAGLVSLAKKYQAFLYIDDAHAVGIYGQNGWGKTQAYANDIDMVMGTWSKALGSFGGYIACSNTMRHYLINKCKGLIYSTGLSPAILGAITAAMEIIPTLHNERRQLLANADKLRSFFVRNGFDCGTSNTHIVPWIIGEARKTRLASDLLEKHGILGTTIRPPTVPEGKCRIRFCLSSAHTDEDLSCLMSAIQKVEEELRLMHDSHIF